MMSPFESVTMGILTGMFLFGVFVAADNILSSYRCYRARNGWYIEVVGPEMRYSRTLYGRNRPGAPRPGYWFTYYERINMYEGDPIIRIVIGD